MTAGDTPPVVLTVAGTDSGGAAGIAADLATFGQFGCHGASVVTAVTAQDTTGVHAVHQIPPGIVAAQMTAVTADLPVAAVKMGMLGSPEVVRLVADRLAHLPLVVDPVLVATSGAVLGDEAVVAAYREHLLPIATLLTPNLDEAQALSGSTAPAWEVSARLADLGSAVVVTGGPEYPSGDRAASASEGPSADRAASASERVEIPAPVHTCTDWLCLPGGTPVPLTHPAVASTADHGSGCTFASAVAACLARSGPIGQSPIGGGRLRLACEQAATYVTRQLITSSTWTLGRGRGPIAHIPPHHPHHQQEEST